MASFRSNSSNSRNKVDGSSHSNVVLRNRSEDQDLIECWCKEPAVLRTVTKMGPNRGRKFWGCREWVPNDDAAGCGYFNWLSKSKSDETQEQTQQVGTQCVECCKKEMVIMSITRKLSKKKNEEKSTKYMLKMVVVICLFLVVICVITTIGWIVNSLK